MNNIVIKNTFVKIAAILKIACFVLIFLFLLDIVSKQYFPEDIATSYKNRLKDAYSFISEKDNTIDIVCTGNSDLYSAFSPLDLWNDYGYTSTVCASGKQTPQESVHLMESVFKKQKPSLVIIETDMLYDHGVKSEKKKGQQTKYDEFFDRLNPDFFDNEVTHRFSALRFHNKWQKDSSQNKQIFSTHGYRYNCTVCPLKPKKYMKRTTEITPISTVKEEQMDSLVNMCRENGANILLVEVPSITSWNYKRHNAVTQYAESRKLDFLDLNLFTKEIGIDFDYSFRDNGNHLNYFGAQAVTSWLGDYISDHYNIESRKYKKGYSHWNEDYNLFRKKVKLDLSPESETKKVDNPYFLSLLPEEKIEELPLSTYLIDKKTIKETNVSLNKSRLRNTKVFKKWTEDFAYAVRKKKDLSTDWRAPEKLKGNLYDCADYWEKSYDFSDANCRMTSMLLMGDLLNVGKQKKSYNGTFLMMDLDAIENNKRYSVLKKREKDFITVFGEMKIPKQGLSKALENKWKKYKIKLNSKNVSLISVVMEDTLSKKAFIGHSGLLINKDGYFLFVEKLAFEQPYQVTKVKNVKQLLKMLSTREEYSAGDDEEPSVICMNEKMIGRIGNVGARYKKRSKEAYRNEKKTDTSVDIVCTGHSDLYSGFSPLNLWDSHGFTSAVCALGKQTPGESLCFMKQVFKKQRPKLVIIETDMMFKYGLKAEKLMAKSKKQFVAAEKPERLNPQFYKNEVKKLFSVQKHNSKRKNLTKADTLLINTHGYKYFNKVYSVRKRNYMKYTKKAATLSPSIVKDMDKLIDYCQSRDAKVLLVELPTISSWNYERHNAVQAYAKQKKLKFVDLNLYLNKVGISFDYSYRDNGNHLNYLGAEAVTMWMGDYISNKYNLKNHKNEKVYSYWNDDYILLRKRVKLDMLSEKKYNSIKKIG